MKKIFIVWVAIVLVCGYLAIHFTFPAKAGGAEKEDCPKQAVLELCRANIRLAGKVEELLKRDGVTVCFVYDEVNEKIVQVPNADYFRNIGESVKQGGENIDNGELAKRLADDNRVLRTAERRLSPRHSSRR